MEKVQVSEICDCLPWFDCELSGLIIIHELKKRVFNGWMWTVDMCTAININWIDQPHSLVLPKIISERPVPKPAHKSSIYGPGTSLHSLQWWAIIATDTSFTFAMWHLRRRRLIHATAVHRPIRTMFNCVQYGNHDFVVDRIQRVRWIAATHCYWQRGFEIDAKPW